MQLVALTQRSEYFKNTFGIRRKSLCKVHTNVKVECRYCTVSRLNRMQTKIKQNGKFYIHFPATLRFVKTKFVVIIKDFTSDMKTILIAAICVALSLGAEAKRFKPTLDEVVPMRYVRMEISLLRQMMESAFGAFEEDVVANKAGLDPKKAVKIENVELGHLIRHLSGVVRNSTKILRRQILATASKCSSKGKDFIDECIAETKNWGRLELVRTSTNVVVRKIMLFVKTNLQKLIPDSEFDFNAELAREENAEGKITKIMEEDFTVQKIVQLVKRVAKGQIIPLNPWIIKHVNRMKNSVPENYEKELQEKFNGLRKFAIEKLKELKEKMADIFATNNKD